MAGGRGNRKEADGSRGSSESTAGRPSAAVPELLRRALSLGFSGFFLTEAAVRRALGDTVPRDWVDFVVEQSERTRTEFLERLSHEIAAGIDRIDLASALSELLDGHTVEVTARIRLVDDGEDAPAREPTAAPRRGTRAGGR